MRTVNIGVDFTEHDIAYVLLASALAWRLFNCALAFDQKNSVVHEPI